MLTPSTTSIIQAKEHDAVHTKSGGSVHNKVKWVFHVTGNKIMNSTQNVFPLHIPFIQCLKLILHQKVQISHYNNFRAWKASNLISSTRLGRAKYKQVIKWRHNFVIKLY